MIIHLDADYSQICLFDPGLENPFNDWDSEQTDQGFTFRPGSVSFGTIDEQTEWEFTLELTEFKLRQDVSYIRIIQLPFEVLNDGLEIGGVLSSKVYNIESGNYKLTFAIFDEAGQLKGSLNLLRTEEPVEAVIIKEDAELNPPYPLKMTAVPA